MSDKRRHAHCLATAAASVPLCAVVMTVAKASTTSRIESSQTGKEMMNHDELKTPSRRMGTSTRKSERARALKRS
eukprot:scaffold85601_cov31-Tisochrysis_lutea.AAC.2